MRCKKIFIFIVLLLFLALQVTPVVAKNQPQSPTQTADPIIDNPEDDPNGGGEEHPWEDNEDDGDFGVNDGKSTLDMLISQIINFIKGDQKTVKGNSKKDKDSKSKRASKTLFRKFK